MPSAVPIRERGSVIATGQMFGALGILIFTALGGRLFDSWGPWAPFVLVGSYQATLLLLALVVRYRMTVPTQTAASSVSG